MAGPTLGDPSSMTFQFYDGEPVAATTLWTPTLSGKSFARGYLCTTSGNLEIDFQGIEGTTGNTAITIAVIAGTTYPIAFKKIYAASTAAGVALY